MNLRNRLFVILALFGFLVLGLQSRSRAGRAPYRPSARPPYAAATPAPTPIPCLPVTIPGDYDRDCDVDNADYLVWQSQFGNHVPAYCGADGSGNGIIDAADQVIWTKHNGTSQPGCHAAPIKPISPPDTKNYIKPSQGDVYNMIVNLGKPAHVQVDVYTIQGKKVKGLLDSDLAAGSHTVSWDAKNEDGSLVSSDMYVVLIYQDGHLSQKKKVIIQR